MDYIDKILQIHELSKCLIKDIENEFDKCVLKRIHHFYLTFPICDAVRHKLNWMHYLMPVGDYPTIGLILCSKRNEAIVKYSILNDNKNIFASKYLLYLPTEEELKREIEKERNMMESLKEEGKE